MEMWPRIPLILLFGAFLVHCYASSDVVFFESFDEPFEGRWTVSNKDEYTGVWKRAKSEGHDDYGLLVAEKARKYGIVKKLNKPLSLNDGTIVLQYEVRFQKGLDCGGAYLKFLQPQEAGWTPKDFNSNSPYSIMFGPDKCGMTNKVHFIFRHKNPKSGDYLEHHLTSPPFVSIDNFTHVYTAIFKPGHSLWILIDGVERKKVNFMSTEYFEPPLIPEKTIPDPTDKKPEDWDDRVQVPDAYAVKPDDWDENAPMEILDMDAVKPEGWLEDEPEEIDDPDAEKPEDWDEDEDGEWESPRIPNPKCELAPGCGKWTRPMIRNPAYKGKWYPPMIDNPNYKGIWEPKRIPNPDYFEMEKPDFLPISAIGIEIWTMQDGLLFDNILITKSEATAKSYRETLWAPKIEAEKQKVEEESGSNVFVDLQDKMFELLYKIGDIPFLEAYKPKIIKLIGKAEKQPNLTIGILVSIVILILTILLRTISGGKKPPAKVHHRSRRAKKAPSSNPGSDRSESEKEDAPTGNAPRKKSSRKAN